MSTKIATEKQVKDVADTFTELYNIQGKKIEGLESGIIDAIIPSSPIPSKVGQYAVTEPGLYLNFKDENNQPINISSDDFSIGNNYIVFNGVSSRKLIVPIVSIGKIDKFDTRSTSGKIVYDYINQGNFTYDVGSRKDLALEFITRVKNIYITSDYHLDNSNVELSYVGINNTNYQLFTVQLIFNSNGEKTPVNYYFPKGLTNIKLSGNIVKALLREKLSEIGIKTQVYFEFYDFSEIPTDRIIVNTAGQSTLTKNAFASNSFKYSLKKNETFDVLEGMPKSTEILNTIKNVFVKSKIRDVKENVKVSYFAMNNENRWFLIQLKYKDETPISYMLTKTESNNVGGEIVKMNLKEDFNEFGKQTDVYIEFNDFETFPNYSFLQANDNYFFALTDNAFNIPNNKNAFINQDIDVIGKNIINVSYENGGYNAIQDAIDGITDNNKNNIYDIIVKQGHYKADNSKKFKGYRPDYPAFICPKDFVNIIGIDKKNTIIDASLPYNDADIDTSIARDRHQTVYNFANECTMKNLTIIGSNLRYTLHQDAPQESNKVRYYIDVDWIFKGNKGLNTTHGIGTYSGSETYFIGGKSICEVSNPLAIHNNQAFHKISKWSFTNHEFLNLNTGDIFHIQNSGSLVGDIFELIGCSFGGGFILSYIDWWIYTHNVNSSFNHAEWRILGNGNAPLYFKNTVEGYSLAIKSNTKGDNSKVRFKGGSAYDILIKNPHDNKFGNLGHPERYIVDNSYIVFDGGGDFEGYAIGCVGIREKNFLYGTTVSSEPMGKRLGDCSVNNKNLIISIDGSDIEIIFNKNYSLMTNADIITDINLKLNNSASAYIANIGADYYPELTDVNFTIRNYEQTKSIPKGTIVTLDYNAVRVCGPNDTPFGILIDDLKPFKITEKGITSGYGRVIKKCYVTTTPGTISSVKTNGNSNRYKIIDGVLEPDINGPIKSTSNLILIP